nr:MAG TPA: hypothetical protein [Caudoviricetes sp.]
MKMREVMGSYVTEQPRNNPRRFNNSKYFQRFQGL